MCDSDVCLFAMRFKNITLLFFELQGIYRYMYASLFFCARRMYNGSEPVLRNDARLWVNRGSSQYTLVSLYPQRRFRPTVHIVVESITNDYGDDVKSMKLNKNLHLGSARVIIIGFDLWWPQQSTLLER